MRERTLKIINREIEMIETQLKRIDTLKKSVEDAKAADEIPSLDWLQSSLRMIGNILRSSADRIKDSLDDQTNLTVREYIIRERLKGKKQKQIAARLGLFQTEVSTILKGEIPLSEYVPAGLKKFQG